MSNKEKILEFIRLVQANPELPVLPMVDEEIVADNCCIRWMASIGNSYIKEYFVSKDAVYFRKDDDWGEINDLLTYLYGDKAAKMTNEEALRHYQDDVPWVKAIILEIDPPEGE